MLMFYEWRLAGSLFLEPNGSRVGLGGNTEATSEPLNCSCRSLYETFIVNIWDGVRSGFL